MAPDGFLRGVLADGARPFHYRAGVRELLGAPEDNGVRISFPSTLPRGGFRYVRAAAPRPQGFADMPGWLAETDNFEVDDVDVVAAPAPVRAAAPEPVFLDEPLVTAVPSSLVTEVVLPPEPTVRRPEVARPPAVFPPSEEVRAPQAASVLRAMESQAPQTVPAPVVAQPVAQPGAAVEPEVVTVAMPVETPSAVKRSPAAIVDTAPQWTVPSTVDWLETTPSAPEPARALQEPIHALQEPVRVVPERARAVPVRKRSTVQPVVVRSVDAPNTPPHRPVRRPVDVPVFDAPYVRPAAAAPVTPEPTPVEPPPPAPAVAPPPRLVVVRAPAPVEEEPAFWERRQLGRLLNRISR
ncbi:hypothetical protein [Kutzneria chonburiensis]|uniref:Uncharacterized protein n=1 Tax=Kutzneria chonburiensis TaxID=1483604 RepID=A0ABV6MMJ2_9PSEU|nr:hypothetical protein [Kutzneria chonburiensis]